MKQKIQKLGTILRKDEQTTKEDAEKKIAIDRHYLKYLPKKILEYPWSRVSFFNWGHESAYADSLTLYAQENDPLDTAIATAWLISIFESPIIGKPTVTYSGMPSISARVTINGRKLDIIIVCHKARDCKKIEITRFIPAKAAEIKKEYALVCPGEEMPKGAVVVE